MRGWLVVIAVVLAACKGGKDKVPQEHAGSAKPVIAVPKVEIATVLGTIEQEPPLLVVLDEAGKLYVNAVDRWSDVATKDLKAGAKTADLDTIDKRTREAFFLGQSAKKALAHWDDVDAVEEELAKQVAPPPGLDDPPPPEEEDRPDDGADESGGTGTAMALEEGKMGKQDADRAEGQYQMKKAADDPELARRQQMGKRGSLAFETVARDVLRPDGAPARLADVAGEVIENGKLERMRTVVFVPPATKATKLIELVARLEGAIAVAHAGTVRPLRMSFVAEHASWWGEAPWVEARVTAKGVTIEAVPDVPIELASLDAKALAAALDKARTERDLPPLTPVDVLVASDLDAQRLVDVLVALDTAGVRMIGMGAMPTGEEMKRRGKRMPGVAFGQPNAQGDLDKAIIRRFVKRSREKIMYCYEKALLAKPKLEGTVNVQFFIDPKGKVASASASGVDPEVAKCVEGVIKAIEFPPPKGGGGVQVNYPFTMRQ